MEASSPSPATLACAAASGDDRAWIELVKRFDPDLRRAVQGYRLSVHDVDDVVQTTWLQAFTKLSGLRDPEAIGGWLVVVARREALRTLQRGVREVLTCDERDRPDPVTPERIVLEQERSVVLTSAVERLSGRRKSVLRELLRRPGRTYQELSADLSMPIGSIGPTRERALETLRADRHLKAVVSS